MVLFLAKSLSLTLSLVLSFPSSLQKRKIYSICGCLNSQKEYPPNSPKNCNKSNQITKNWASNRLCCDSKIVICNIGDSIAMCASALFKCILFEICSSCIVEIKCVRLVIIVCMGIIRPKRATNSLFKLLLAQSVLLESNELISDVVGRGEKIILTYGV